MSKTLKEKFDEIPWASVGRPTAISRLAKSILPVGFHAKPLPTKEKLVRLGEDGWEEAVMTILGTSLQVGRGKLLTCEHVAASLPTNERRAYVQNLAWNGSQWVRGSWPIVAGFPFIDPRWDKENDKIDAAMLICPAKSGASMIYDAPPIKWGDSTKLGVGMRVLIGGYPLGEKMELMNDRNRGFIQPTFYDGIISGITPAIVVGESRLLQISSHGMGGISGGVVCLEDGKVVGMVTSGLPGHPITWAIPTEVLEPWCDGIRFETEDGEIWR